MPSFTSSFKWPFKVIGAVWDRVLGLCFGSKEKGPVAWHVVGRRVLLTLLIATLAWEGCWRWNGFVPTHKDDVALWGSERDRLRTAGPEAIAVVGSSRIFYGLETDMIREQTGRPVIQLAVNGMTPVPVLEDLAADESFAGVVLCGISLQAIFGVEKHRAKGERWLEGYRRLTRLDRWNHRVTRVLETIFVYPSKEELGFQLLTHFQILTSQEPENVFAPGSTQLSIVDERRGSYVTDFVMRERNVRHLIVGMQLRDIGVNPVVVEPEIKAEIMARFRDAVAKIQARGGKVVFVLYPSGGAILERENLAWPRDDYWEPLATLPGVTAIHYTDYPVLAQIKTVEDSHISRPDRIIFTRELLRLFNEAWVFDR